VALGDQPATQVALLALQGDGALRFSCGGLAEQAVVGARSRNPVFFTSAAAPSSSTTSRTWRWHALGATAAMACCAPR
jgi:hypothetical protein